VSGFYDKTKRPKYHKVRRQIDMNYASYADTVFYAEASERAAFIRRT
jgi:hypothetical protein